MCQGTPVGTRRLSSSLPCTAHDLVDRILLLGLRSRSLRLLRTRPRAASITRVGLVDVTRLPGRRGGGLAGMLRRRSRGFGHRPAAAWQLVNRPSQHIRVAVALDGRAHQHAQRYRGVFLQLEPTQYRRVGRRHGDSQAMRWITPRTRAHPVAIHRNAAPDPRSLAHTSISHAMKSLSSLWIHTRQAPWQRHGRPQQRYDDRARKGQHRPTADTARDHPGPISYRICTRGALWGLPVARM